MKSVHESTKFVQPTLPFSEAEHDLPSAKQRTRNRTKQPWGKFLAAFSQPFAESALKMLYRDGGGLLYDPFVGSGTTALAAAKLGISVVGNDLDPASAVISRARIAVRAEPAKIRQLLDSRQTKVTATFAQEASSIFHEETLSYASGVFSKLKRRLPDVDGNGSVLAALLADHAGQFDSEAVALAAIIVAADSAARTIRGSNPVWHRRAVVGERIKTKPLADGAVRYAMDMIEDLKGQEFPTKRKVHITCADARSQELTANTVDAVLTSPPYLNRLDYVINHLPQLLLLSGLQRVDIETLRRSMTGTTKILSKVSVNPQVGRTCLKLLKQIREHPSYASAAYYHPTYVQYFNDMLLVFQNLRRQCKPGARGILVMQTSYYKDVLIDSITVFREMAQNSGFEVRKLAKEEVATHYGNLSPAQNRYVSRKRLHEYLLYLQF